MGRWAAHSLVLIAACLASGWAAGLFFHPPVVNTVVWPPVGFALVGLMAGGRRLLPAAWVGLTLPLVAMSGDYADRVDDPTRWFLALLLGTLYAGQAWAGAWAVRRWVGAEPALVRPGEIFRFLLIAGPAHTLPVAVAAGLMYCGAGVGGWGVFPQAVVQVWWTDAVGGALFATVALAAVGRPRAVWRPRIGTVAVPVLAAAALAALGFEIGARADEDAAARRVNEDTAGAAATLASELPQLADVLMNARDAYPAGAAGVPEVRSELRFLRRAFPGVRGVGVVVMIADEDRAAFEAAAAALGNGRRPFRVTDAGPDGAMIPAARRAEYAVVADMDPAAGNENAIGYDTWADAGRRDVFERAAAAGRPALGRPFAPVQAPDRRTGVLLVIPFPAAAPGGRVRGFLGAILDRDRVAAGLAVGRDPRLRFALRHPATDPPPAAPPGGFVSVRPLTLFGDDWELAAAAPADYLAEHRGGTARVAAAGGFGLAAALAVLLLVLTGRTALAAADAATQTAALEEQLATRELTAAVLRESETRLAEAQRIAGIGYWEWDPVTGDVAWTADAEPLLGPLPDGGADFAALADRIHPADRAAFRAAADAAVAARTPQDLEFRVLAPGGGERWAAGGLTALALDGPLRVRGTLQDVTARKAADEARRQTEERFRQAFEFAPIGKVLARPDGRFEKVNAALCRFFRRTEADLLAVDFQSLTHPADLSPNLNLLAQALAGGGDTYQMEKRYRMPDGSYAWGLLGVSIIRDAAGVPVQLVGQIADIDARKKAEAALAASEARLADAQRIAQIGYWEWDPVSNAVWWSDVNYKLFGYAPGSVPADYPHFLAAVHPDDRPLVRDRMRATAGQGDPYVFDYRVVRGGEERVLHVEAVVDRDATGHPRLWRGTNQDVTDRKRAEEDRRRFDDRLRESQKLESLGVLAGGVAHDFNNLLTGILGNASLIRELLPPGSEYHEFLRPIEHAATHAAYLCQQMLAYAGRGTTVRGPQDLNAVVAGSVELVKLSVSKKTDLKYALAADVPAVVADAGQLRQVLMNLVSNASEAAGEAGGAVEISTGFGPVRPAALGGRTPDLPAGDYAWLQVRDFGCGMPPAVVAKVFEPFFSTKFTGRGLGLSAVHGIILGHGGGIGIDTAPGAGTTFRVYLPAGPGDGPDRTMPRVIHTPRLIRNTPRPTPGLAPTEAGLVVVTDDDPAVRRLAAVALRGLGFGVLEAENGREMLTLVAANPGRVTLVVLDMLMPVLAGPGAAAALFRLAPEIPVVVVSGYAEGDLADQFAGIPVAAYLQKPFRPTDLVACVRGAALKAVQ